MKKNFLIIMFLSVLKLVGCSSHTKTQPYKDKFPQPCTDGWYAEIEQEVNLVDVETGRPPPGSPQWIAALDEKYTIAKNTSTDVGSLDWCHQVHQQFIGL